MGILFETNISIQPKLSIILVDWSCRDSFHVLDYLNSQTVPRDQYEIIWIEYYSCRSSQIEEKLRKSQQLNKPAVVDKWIVMEMPDDVYYHKHLMYNVGIIVSKGKITAICDSDAIVKPTFIESIIKAFEDNPDMVLHMDQVRNADKRFYPFNYPSIDEITGKGCINWVNGKTAGIFEKKDSIHVRNYGACMCALREDLISIGGADEHIDYLGHICGSYELTFRLINNGKKEVWHEEEFLYHVWHPGINGKNNYLGPHDGMNMSVTALDILKNGRVMPFVENDAIREFRLNGKNVISLEKLFTLAVSAERIRKWKKTPLKHYLFWCFMPLAKSFLFKIKLFLNMVSVAIRQLRLKSKCNVGNKAMPKTLFLKFIMAFVFLKRMCKNNVYTIRTCHQTIRELRCSGIKEAVFYGAGNLTKVLYILAKEHSIEVKGIYDPLLAGRRFLGFEIKNDDAIKDYAGKVIVNYFNGINEKIERLQSLGIQRNNIVRLQ